MIADNGEGCQGGYRGASCCLRCTLTLWCGNQPTAVTTECNQAGGSAGEKLAKDRSGGAARRGKL